MQRIAILFLTVLFCSCKSDQLNVKIGKVNDLIIADTSVEANQFLQFSDYRTDYPIYYVGPGLDTVKIGQRYWAGRTLWTDHFEYPWSKRYSEKTVSIYVDTSFKTNSPVEYFSNTNRIVKDSTINYHSFLFTIRNISDTAIYLGRTFSVFFIHRQAKDKSGHWVNVDRKLSELGICGVGQPTIILKPNEIVISKVRRYSGNFSTDFRLVFGNENNVVYSNTFKDSIDERMLVTED